MPVSRVCEQGWMARETSHCGLTRSILLNFDNIVTSSKHKRCFDIVTVKKRKHFFWGGGLGVLASCHSVKLNKLGQRQKCQLWIKSNRPQVHSSSVWAGDEECFLCNELKRIRLFYFSTVHQGMTFTCVNDVCVCLYSFYRPWWIVSWKTKVCWIYLKKCHIFLLTRVLFCLYTCPNLMYPVMWWTLTQSESDISWRDEPLPNQNLMYPVMWWTLTQSVIRQTRHSRDKLKDEKNWKSISLVTHRRDNQSDVLILSLWNPTLPWLCTGLV